VLSGNVAHAKKAAEILDAWDGWPEENQTRFEKMLREIFYPIIKDFYPSANGNWDASMIQTMLAMGVFLDDQAMFDRAKNYYLNGEGNGAVRNYFKPSGECQESGRDQAHTQMGLDFLACSAEIALDPEHRSLRSLRQSSIERVRVHRERQSWLRCSLRGLREFRRALSLQDHFRRQPWTSSSDVRKRSQPLSKPKGTRG
jgi:hypothetical protein